MWHRAYLSFLAIACAHLVHGTPIPNETSFCRDDTWIEFGRQCYFHNATELSFEQCEDFCVNQLSANLPCIEDAVANDFLWTSFGASWIGRAVFAPLMGQEEREFGWLTEHCLSTFQDWVGGAAQNSVGGEHCVLSTNSTGEWLDVDCGSSSEKAPCTCQERSTAPSEAPSAAPSVTPSEMPTKQSEPSSAPSELPTVRPTVSAAPTVSPAPTSTPSSLPTFMPLDCDPGWDSYEDQCFYKHPESVNYEQCESICSDMGAATPCIYTKGMSDFMLSKYGHYTWSGVEDRATEGVFGWTDKRCLSDYMPLQTSHHYIGLEDCFVLMSGSELWGDTRCTGSATCACQKPHPSKVTPRGSCFEGSGNPTCFPYKCAGIHGNDTCWENNMKPEDIHNEYLFSSKSMTALEHEAQAKEWNGNLIVSPSTYEKDLFHADYRYGDNLYFKTPQFLTQPQCEAFCYANGASQPCVNSYDMNNALRAWLGVEFWSGATDFQNQGTWRFSDTTCPDSARSWRRSERVCWTRYVWIFPVGIECRTDIVYDPLPVYGSNVGDGAVSTPTRSNTQTNWRIVGNSYTSTCICESRGHTSSRDLLVKAESGNETAYFAVGNDGSLDAVLESFEARAGYKREKQLLNITLNSVNGHHLLVPAVRVDPVPFELRTRSHPDRIIGSYKTSGDNSEVLSLSGTQMVTYMLRAFLYESETPVLRWVTFQFEPPSLESSCYVKLCFLGNCEQLNNGGTFTIGGVDLNDPQPYQESEYLVFQQICPEEDKTTTSRLSNIQLTVVGCPRHSVEGAPAVFGEVIPRCVCVDGYRDSENDEKDTDRDGTCTRVAEAEVLAEKSSLVARVLGINEDRYNEVESFYVEMTKKIAPSEWVSVAPVDGTEIYREEDPLATLPFKNLPARGLQSGRWYRVTFIPRDQDGKDMAIDGGITRVTGYGMTHCSCTVKTGEGDTTGTPLELKVTQEEGFVLFSFQDDSTCEDSYAFTRQWGTASTSDDKEKKSFTANYYFYSLKPCAQNPVEPGRQASDDLRISKLPVGQDYTYCVRATARDYMDNPAGHNHPTGLASSNEECSTHRIRWEASVKGKVTLEPTAGSLPVENVTIAWELLNDDFVTVLRSGTLKTGPGGTFKIVFNEDLVLENNAEFPIRVRASKQTHSGNETFDHSFTCNDGQVDCGIKGNGTYVYVSHLDFDTPLRVIDTSSVLFSGKVVVGGTDSQVSGDGCPIAGAEVCLLDLNSQGKARGELCSETNSLGEYFIGAVLGTRVIVDVRYRSHEFQRLDKDQDHLDVEGVLIEAGKSYSGNDFQDITKTKLLVDVAGGLCDKVLGTSWVQVKISGGCAWTSDVYKQGGFRGEHWVPAHVLDVKVVDVFDMVDGSKQQLHPIRDFFGDMVRTIDLRDIDDEEEEMLEEEESELANATATDEDEVEKPEEAQDTYKVRFQYDGVLKTKSIVAGDRLSGEDSVCGMDDYLYQKITNEGPEAPESGGGSGCDSLHVLGSPARATMTLLLQYELKVGLYCDIVSDDLSIQVFNYLGPTEDEKKVWPSYPKLTDSQKELLDLCNEEAGGCAAPVQHDVIENTTKSRARTEGIFLTGPPNVNGDFLRYVDFVIGEVSHKACFLLEGQYSRGKLDSFAFPTYEPLMVLRDPPGGLSYASYNNMRTSISLESTTHQFHTGFDMGLDVLIGADVKQGVCAGGGFGFMVLACLRTTAFEAKGGVKVDAKNQFEVMYDEYNNKGTFTTTWSYQTSTDPYRPGHQSDVFVVPNVNVAFEDVTTIQWNATTCTASSRDSRNWAFDSANQESAISFLSISSIKESIIPTLEDELLGLDPADSDFDDKAAALTAGLGSWGDFLREYERTNEAAIEGTLKTVPANWFDKTSEVMQNEDEEKLPSSVLPSRAHWGGLVPQGLVDKAVGARPLSPNQPDERDAEEELGSTNRIHFSGGGGKMTFEMSYSKMKKHQFKVGPARENQDGTYTAGVNLKNSFKLFGAKFKADFTPKSTNHYKRSHHKGEEDDSSTKVSFVLGDNDLYGTDDFEVDVYTDEKYGTFVFHTAGGQSRCPHEAGTAPAAEPKIEVYERAGPIALPNEPMLFKLRLTNGGVRSSGFQLKVDNADNIGMLNPVVNGASLAIPQAIALDAGESIETTVAIYRGPEEYDYPPLTFVFRANCERPFASKTAKAEVFNVGAGVDPRIRFARPCPQVHWSGDLLRDQKFILNEDSEESLPVTVFNPQSAVHSFEDLVDNDRLEAVLLQYREVGDTLWKDAMQTVDTSLEKVNFVGGEDPYGYTTLPWSYVDSQIQEGEFEIRLQTRCSVVSGAPDDFNRYTTKSIHGLIDRTAPAPYGLVDPRGTILPGEELSFQFTERIQCAKPFRFDLAVLVEDSDFFDGPVADELLDVTCDGTRIGFAFDAGKIDLAELVGKSIDITISNVVDLAGNVMAEPLRHKAEHAATSLDEASVSFKVMLAGCDDFAAAGTLDSAAKDAATEQIASSLNLTDSSRIVIETMSCNVQSDTLTASVTILPASDLNTPAPPQGPSGSESTPAPSSTTPSPSTSTPAPSSATPAPSSATPAPSSTTPAPSTLTPAPSTSTPAPSSATPAPTEGGGDRRLVGNDVAHSQNLYRLLRQDHARGDATIGSKKLFKIKGFRLQGVARANLPLDNPSKGSEDSPAVDHMKQTLVELQDEVVRLKLGRGQATKKDDELQQLKKELLESQIQQQKELKQLKQELLESQQEELRLLTETLLESRSHASFSWLLPVAVFVLLASAFWGRIPKSKVSSLPPAPVPSIVGCAV